MEMTLLAFSRRFAAACAALTLSFPAAAFVYSSDKVRIRLIDGESGKPIPSVIGVAIWIVEQPSFVTGRVHRPIAIEEAVTDSEGWVEFPAWKTERPFEASYTSNAPRILLYHEDYRPIFLVNEITMERNITQPAISRWSNKEVVLERARGDPKERVLEVGEIDVRLPDPEDDPGNPCWFERFPRMLSALDKVDMQYRQHSILASTKARAYRSRERTLMMKGCQSVSELISRPVSK